MWRTVDPDGREVVLEPAGWSHVLRRHAYIDVTPEELVDTVARPDARREGRDAGEVWFYRRDLGPSAWIRVVVHYEHGRGLILTAFPRRWFP